MLRHEYVFQYEAPAPGAFESEHVPVVFDGDLGHRDQKIALMAAILRVETERTDETPLGVTASARKRIASAQSIAARTRLRCTP